MPKKPPRNNPPDRERRTVQSAASLLRRISQKSGVLVSGVPGAAAGLGALQAPQTLIERVRAQLPEDLRPRLVSCLEKPGELVLFADSAGWATRLKLSVAELPGLAAGRRCTVRVMPREGYRK